MSGATALLVIGLVVLALASGAFVIVLRRLPARSQAAVSTEQLAEHERAARELAAQAQLQAQADGEQIRARAQADADRILAMATEAAE